MHPTGEGDEPPDARVIADQKPAESPPLNQWQFSLRSLLMLVTGWALLLSVAMTVPGLNELPILIGAVAVSSTALFGIGCLLGWIAKRASRNRDNPP
jgi:hypothetical protein